MPSTLLDARRITRHHGPRTVLDAIDLRLDAGRRIALIGPNGSGKSTLLRILAGLERPDAGAVRAHGTVGYLPQLASEATAAGGATTVRDTILERIGVAAAGRRLDALAARLQDGDLAALEPHAEALERWLALGGDDAGARLAAAAADLGLGADLLDRPLRTLSGGQAARAGLAALRTARFDVVLLDEPTNHLDDEGLGHLAELLAERAGGVVLVSHDRALLAEAAHELLELDPRTGGATRYAGGWDAYERERDTAHRRAVDAHGRAVARRTELEQAEREVRRRAQASVNRARRAPRDGDKHVQEWVRSRAEGMGTRARVIAGRAARVEVPDKPWEDAPLHLELDAAERRARYVVALERAIVRHGRPRRCRRASARGPSSPSSGCAARRACCSTSRRTTSTSPRWKRSRPRSGRGPARSSSRRTTDACATPSDSSARSRCEPAATPRASDLGRRATPRRRVGAAGRPRVQPLARPRVQVREPSPEPKESPCVASPSAPPPAPSSPAPR